MSIADFCEHTFVRINHFIIQRLQCLARGNVVLAAFDSSLKCFRYLIEVCGAYLIQLDCHNEHHYGFEDRNLSCNKQVKFIEEFSVVILAEFRELSREHRLRNQLHNALELGAGLDHNLVNKVVEPLNLSLGIR